MPDIVMRNASGEDVIYNNVKAINVRTTTEGETATFSLGGSTFVNANWNQNDSTKDDYIENRPFYTDDDGTVHKLDSKYLPDDIKVEQVQSDWYQEDENAYDYIKNKPNIPSIKGLATETYVDEQIANNIKNNCHYEGIIGIDGNTVEEIFNNKKPENGYISGDTFVIKTTIIKDNKYSYTAYVYDNSEWKAMDGNYNAENVYFDEDIIITQNVGNITTTNGSGKIPSAGKNLKQVFESLWTKELDPIVTDPSVTINTNTSYYEIGLDVTPSYSVSFNPGSYTYGPETGIEATSWSIVFGSETKNVTSGNFNEITVTEGNCCEIKAKATYNENINAIPLTNLGNERENLRIESGNTKEVSKNLIVGYRPNFYGFKYENEEIDIGNLKSDNIRQLTNQEQNINTFIEELTPEKYWMQFFYAVPEGRKILSKVINTSNNSPFTINTATINIIHNEENDITSNYTIFYIQNDTPCSPSLLKLTWKNNS